MKKLLILLFVYFASLQANSQEIDNNLKQGKSLYQYKEYAKALPYLQNAAKAGYGEALYLCGNMYRYGWGTEKNPEIALRMFTRGIEAGYTEGEAEIGVMYEYGEGVSKDINKAVQYYRQSTERGNTWGRSLLADCYFYAKGVEQDYEKAFQLYLQSAKEKHSYSAMMVGYIYDTGKGTSVDYKKAFNWYNQSNEPFAAFNRALLAYNGKATDNKPDVKLGRIHMEAAAQDGFGVEAEYLCGLWYDEERIIEKQHINYMGNKSLKWIRKAADKNHPAALKRLGDYYRDGLYVPMNKQLAKECYTKSAALGNNEAAEALKNL